MAIKLPNDKICYNLPEQVAANAENVASLASQWNSYKEELNTEWGNYKTTFEAYSYQWENEILPAFNDIPNEVLSILEENEVIVKKIDIKEFNFEEDVKTLEDLDTALKNQDANLEVLSSYYKIAIIGRILYIVCEITIKNNGASSFTVNGAFANKQVSDLPLSVQQKIYDGAGRTIDQSPAGYGDGVVSNIPAKLGTGSLSNAYLVHGAAGRLDFYNQTSFTLGAGARAQLSFRSFLILV